jgi:hypothetical protein
MPVTLENLHDVITYARPDANAVARITAVREASENLARAILLNTPACADQQAAIRHVREALMTANAAIVLKGIV